MLKAGTAPTLPEEGQSMVILKNLLLNQQWQTIANHIRTNPADARQSLEFNGIKALPLHVACAIGAPIGVIKSLISAYPTAVQVKNDSGRLPLHCLFLHRCPALGVLSAIIEAYPTASHVADCAGKLPIHYACERNNVADDFFTILLSTYPEGAYARDNSGNFPINYATSNTDLTTRKCALAALDRGTLFASISKMTSMRVMEKQKAKIDALEKRHICKISEMEKHIMEERDRFKSEVESLMSQLKDKSDSNQALTQTLRAAEVNKEEAVNAAIENEQVKTAELEKSLRMELADVQLKNMDLLDQFESVQLDLDESKELNKNKAVEIQALKDELNGACDTIKSLELANAEKGTYITHLEDSLVKAQKAMMALATKQEAMKKAMSDQKKVLNSMLLAHGATADDAGGLFVDMINLADDIGGTVLTAKKFDE